jgi:hypothetical protein
MSLLVGVASLHHYFKVQSLDSKIIPSTSKQLQKVQAQHDATSSSMPGIDSHSRSHSHPLSHVD